MALEHGGTGQPASSAWSPEVRSGVESRPALATRFAQHVIDAGLVHPRSTILVALSGGLDSVVLLHLLRFRVPHLERSLVAAHFDHRMRADSARDAEWVAGLCRAWEVPLVQAAAEEPLRSEAEARSARYRFLRATARRRDISGVATGHHADDQAETVLFRIIRGTGIAGLAGIPERRGVLIRPLLPYPRTELARYAADCHLRWRDDPTNRLLRYARNRLRHEVLPRIEAISPGVAAALNRLSEDAREVEEAWDGVLDRLEAESMLDQAESWIELARLTLLSYHPALRARLLRRLMRRLGSQADRAGTRLALEFISSGASGARIQVTGGLELAREFDRIRIVRPAARGEARPTDEPLVIRGPNAGEGTVVVGGRSVRLRWSCGQVGEEPGSPSDGSAASFDPAALLFPVTVRAWEPGDRIRLAAGTKKLKKLFVERRIGRSQRARIPILVDAHGRVLWVHGAARAAEAEPKPGGPVFRVMEANASAS